MCNAAAADVNEPAKYIIYQTKTHARKYIMYKYMCVCVCGPISIRRICTFSGLAII